MTLRLLGAVGLVCFGLLLGLVGAFVQAHRALVEAPWAVVGIPWGVPLVWVTLLLGIRAGAWLIGTRWGSLGGAGRLARGHRSSWQPSRHPATSLSPAGRVSWSTSSAA